MDLLCQGRARKLIVVPPHVKTPEPQIEYLPSPSLSTSGFREKGYAAAVSQFAGFFRLQG